ncbi:MULTISPECIES: carboxymuconolactone decarboxylase family protein [Paenibacillus]|uniref:carboxymuconolactone decarboxylase family protein n=1 Tax=Paenibacillus TaxID=44249 RepID=UPI0022B87DBB|nr:carboxymuconolactone decarboxylase family protein [Paenibacillus caseinilyticus]MCZ8523909.1 carboxymuconolactone decarboxylase family protein [Paenibacillus caseinilyticus]
MNHEQMNKGQEQLSLMAGTLGSQIVDKLKQEMPELAEYVVGFGFGEIYAREGLSLHQKEMLTIAVLLGQGDTANQLHFHFHAAQHVGLTAQELTEILLHCIPHVGIPRVMNGFRILAAVQEERRAMESSP